MVIEQIFVIAFIVLAINSTMWEGNIFSFIKRFGDKHLPVFIQKPLYDCYICSVPYYGSVAYYFIYQHELKTWVITIIGAMGVNAVFFLISNKD